MNLSKRQKYFQTVLTLAIFLILWNLPQASSFSQNSGGAGTVEGEHASGITMQTVSGKVVKTMNSGGYTYALVDEGGTMTWVALPQSTIAVGNEITCQPGMVMNNFSSTSLNHTFNHIVFSSGITSFLGGSAPPAVTPTPSDVIKLPKIKEPENWKDF